MVLLLMVLLLLLGALLICGVSVRLLSSSFIFDDEFGDNDEVDNEEDSIGPPKSMSSVLT
jgi:hypothetical protein